MAAIPLSVGPLPLAAAIPIVGFNYGAKNGGRIRQVLRTAVPMALGIAAVGTILFEAIPGPLLRMFSASDGALVLGIPGLRVIAVTFLFGSVTTVLGYACSGLGNGLVNMAGTALRQFIPLVPLAYLFGRLGGVGAVWYSLWVSEVLAVVFSALCTRQEFLKKVTPLLDATEKAEE